MKFGPTPLAEAEGAILAHSTRHAGGTFRKGRILSAEDVLLLETEGLQSVIAAVLEDGDVHEDPAAQRLAEGSAGVGVRVGAPFTGRSNLYAEISGLLSVDRERLDALNRIDEGITIATLAPGVLVNPKQMLATIKVIPFSVEGPKLDEALALLQGARPLVQIAGFVGLRAALIQSELPGTKGSVLDKTTRVLSERLGRLDASLIWEGRCIHQAQPVADQIALALAQSPDVVLIAGASAIVDRRDVLPAGIELAKGEVRHFGMPVDPGNLILLGRHGDVAVLGLPGCARSPKYNGVDQVLERLAAGQSVEPQDIMAMGAGGLLKEIAERPQPRSNRAEQSVPAHAPRIAALVMAAGQSRRMGTINKLLAEVGGKAMVRRAVEAALGSGVDRVFVVLGHEGARVRAELAALPVTFVENPEFAEGMSTSLAAGVGALPDGLDGAIITLGDMPRVGAKHLDRLLAAFDPAEGRLICVPTHRGKRGNPVLWSSQYFAEMCELRGDVGARHLIGEHADSVCEVPMPDDGVLLDVDSPSALSQLVAAEER